MLKVGQQAPNFTAQTTDGKTLTLSELRGKRVVLYFFPKAFTPGCTIETRRFRDAYPELKDLGAEVIGVSADEGQRQCEFAQAEGVTFPMIGDAKREIGGLYDTLWPLLGLNQRVTYVIDEQGQVEAVFHHELLVNKHLDQVRAHLRARRG